MLLIGKLKMALYGKSHTLEISEGVGDCQCIMVAHAVYVEGKRLPAGTTSEGAARCIVAVASIVCHVARRMVAERTSRSGCRHAAVAVVAEAATHRGIAVAITRHWTVTMVH